VQAVLKELEENGWHWTAWDLHAAAGPRLISDWSYTPTPNFGALVKEALLSANQKAAPPRNKPPAIP
jgi:hypothetical protein